MEDSNLARNEHARLTALRQLRLLDTGAEVRFDRLTRLASAALNVPMAGIALVDSARVWFKSTHGFIEREFSRESPVFAHAAASAEPTVIPDLQADQQSAADVVVSLLGARSFASIPLMELSGHRIGEFCVFDQRPRAFATHALELMNDIAQMIEAEIRVTAVNHTQAMLAHDLEATRSQLLRDSLTQTWNRAGILEIVGRDEARARRNRQGIGLAMVGLDQFGSIIDAHGPHASEKVLRIVAKRMLDAVRPYDAVGRYDHEQFLVVVVDQDPRVIGSVAERIRQHISRAPISADRKTFSLTASLGAANFGAQRALDRISSIELVGDALARARSNGGDQVVSAM